MLSGPHREWILMMRNGLDLMIEDKIVRESLTSRMM